MQYEYTNQDNTPIRVEITYADLKLIKRVLQGKATIDKLDYREKDLLAQVEEAMRRAAESLQAHYDYELHYVINKEDNNDA